MKRKRGFGKRILAGLLAVLMTVGMMPVDFAWFGVQTVSAQEEEIETYSTTLPTYTKRFLLETISSATSDDGLKVQSSKRSTTVVGGYGVYNSTDKAQNKMVDITSSDTDTKTSYSKNGFVFYSGAGKAGIDSSHATSFKDTIFGEVSYSYGVNTQGTMKYNDGAIETTFENTSDVEVIWAPSGTSNVRRAAMKKVVNGALSGDYLTAASITDTNGNTATLDDNNGGTVSGTYKTTFKEVESGTYQIGSTNSGIIIYDIIITASSNDTTGDGGDNGGSESGNEGGDAEPSDSLAKITDASTVESYDFSATSKIFGYDSLDKDVAEAYSENSYIKLLKGENTSLTTQGGNSDHGLTPSKNFSFEVIVPAGYMGTLTLGGCQWNGCSAQMSVGGVNIGDAVSLKTSKCKDGVDFKYSNSSNNDVRMTVTVIPSGNTYVSTVSYQIGDIPAKQWASNKTGKVTVGDSIFTVTSGNEGSAFTVTTESGSGKVEIAGKEKAVVWADLGGKTLANSIGAGEGVSNVSADGSTVTLTYSDDTTYPSSYKLEVRDLSKAADPKQDGETVTYNLANGSILSELFTAKIASGTEIKSEDGNLILKSAGGMYYKDTTYGATVNANDSIQVKVAGNAQVVLTIASWNTTSVEAQAAGDGTVYISTDENKTTASADTSGTKALTDYTFKYEGEADTLTFTFVGDTSYVSAVKVTNALPVVESGGTHPEKATAVPSVINWTDGKLQFDYTGQTITLSNDVSAASIKKNIKTSGMGIYAFPLTSDNNTLSVDVTFKESVTGNFYLGLFNEASSDENGVRAITTRVSGSGYTINQAMSKAADNVLGTNSFSGSIKAGDVVTITISRDGSNVIQTLTNKTQNGETQTKTTAYGSCKEFTNPGGNVYYGIMVGAETVTITNIKYTSSDGTVLFDQNTYYDYVDKAPVAANVRAAVNSDKNKITVSWDGDDAIYDRKYVLQMKKPNSNDWVDVSTELKVKTADVPVSYDEPGDYQFRVCGTVGNSAENNVDNRNDWVYSDAINVSPSLQKPTITLDYTSQKNSVTFTWTASDGATSYEVYRRSSDESTATKIATATDTTYTDNSVTAETPYYYSVKALSADNFSPVSDEAWTLPTDGHSGDYDEKIYINITERSYNTVFTDKITIKGTAGAPGTMAVYVNDVKKQSVTVSGVGGTFEFDNNITLTKGRNEVKLELSYGDNLKTTKTLNYVYLTNYDIVVDANYTGNDGEVGTYTVGGETKSYDAPTYKTVAAAIAAGSNKIIFVRNGDYNEQLSLGDGNTNITIIGEDSEKTRVYFATCNDKVSGSSRYAVAVNEKATGFTAENITFENSWEYTGKLSNESAEAFYSAAGDSKLIGVRLISNQDTLQVKNNGNGYYLLRCYILGNVDFMWGTNSKVVFDDCDLVIRYTAAKDSAYYTAFGSEAKYADTSGVVYNNCRFTSDTSVGGSGSKYFLGRPYKVSGNGGSWVSSVAFVNCYMGSVLNKEYGYSTWSGSKELSTSDTEYEYSYYYEYGTYGTGYAVNINRRQISATGAAAINTTLNRSAGVSAASTISVKYAGGSKSIVSTGTVKNEANAADTTEYTGYEGDDTGLAQYNMEGFATTSSVTGGGLLKENNTNYYKVTTANQFMDALQAIYNNKSSSPSSVIEVAADLDLGYNMITNAKQYSSSVLASHNPALNSTLLKQTGVSKVYIKGLKNITIFSQNGNTVKHAAFLISGSSNIIIRNLEFDELWEWDEGDSDPDHEPGGYDVNDWDYMTIDSGSSGVWIDHCTFYKAYDGVVDIKTNSSSSPVNITVSWCKFMPGSKNNTFFNAQMAEMEQRYQDPTQASKYPYYKSLRDAGMTPQEIWDYAYGQKKTHLFGQSDSATENKNLNITLANNYYLNSMDRMPRVRYGTAHVYNCYMDSNYLLTARASLELKYGTAIASHIVSNGASSTCDAQVLLENCNLNGIINVLNSGNGSSPSGYINAINSYYSVFGTRYKLEPKVNNTETASDRTLKVTNAASFKSALGYSYVLRDASTIGSTLLSQGGAGAVKMTVLQWEKTKYNDTVPASYTGTVSDSGLPEYVYDTSVGEGFTSGAGSDFSGVVVGGTGNNGNVGSGNESGSVGDDSADNSGSDDDYSDDSSESGSNGSSGLGSDSTGTTGATEAVTDTSADSADDTTPIGDVLTVGDIAGASTILVDDVEFVRMGTLDESTMAVMAAVDSDGNVPEGETVSQTSDELENVIKEQAENSDDFYVFASDEAVLTADAINYIIEEKLNVSIAITDSNNKVKAILALDGSVLETASANFSLNVTVDPRNSKASSATSGSGIATRSYTVVDFDYSGTLPGVFKVSVNVSGKYADGTQLALYYYNEQEGRLENQYQITDVYGGFAEFAISHCSEYVLVDVSAAQSVITTNTLSSPKTGDGNHLLLWVTMMGIVAAAYFGYRAYAKDKKKVR
jgi:pectate lyase/pectin methylesterase-like acyl-CoA thioesterase